MLPSSPSFLTVSKKGSGFQTPGVRGLLQMSGFVGHGDGYLGRLGLGPETPTAYESDPTSRTISGTVSLTLDPAMATTFNEAFAAPQGKAGVFSPGEALGTVTFSAQAQ